jgi:uncharacterized OB-fold protein
MSQEEEKILSSSRKRIPVQEGFWAEPSSPGERPQLLGHKCRDCGEIFFPRRNNGICTHCQSRNLVEMKLSSKGKIYNYTIVEQKPPAYYKGEVPYALGFIELPEGVRLRSLFTGCNLNDLKVGMEVEIVIERLFENDEGDEIITYKFRPIHASLEGKNQ